MFQAVFHQMAELAHQKAELAGRAVWAYFARAALTGAYIGLGAAVVLAIGGPLAQSQTPWMPVWMGLVFGAALTLVVYAGTELFTGNHLVMTIGALAGRVRWRQVGRVWAMSFLGNAAGALLIAALAAASGLFAGDLARGSFLHEIAAEKMTLPFGAAFVRGILSNWLICLAIWLINKVRAEGPKLVVTFVALVVIMATGFEHSVINVALLGLANLIPHAAGVSWWGMAANLLPVTLGNMVGGAFFVAAAHWWADQAAFRAPGLPAGAAPALMRAEKLARH